MCSNQSSIKVVQLSIKKVNALLEDHGVNCIIDLIPLIRKDHNTPGIIVNKEPSHPALSLQPILGLRCLPCFQNCKIPVR
jgi:hypothetical protein